MVLSGDGPDGAAGETYITLAEDLRQQGVATFLFDFSGLGKSPGKTELLGLSVGIENFRKAHSIMLADERIDKSRIALFSSSFGSAVALAGADLTNAYKCLVLKSPAADLHQAYLDNVTADELEDWERAGYSEKFQRDFSVLTDAAGATKAGQRIRIPTLILHGLDDKVVDPRQATDLHKTLNATRPAGVRHRLELIKGLGHRFGKNQWERARKDVVPFLTDALTPAQARKAPGREP